MFKMRYLLMISFLFTFLIFVFYFCSDLKARAEVNNQIQISYACFYKGEMTTAFNKVCYYDCLGSIYAINVKSYQLCPISINKNN